MRISLLLVLTARLSLAAADGGLPVADAKKNLETARTSLTEAVKRIQVEPPANEDLEAAHTAVEALKDAIDVGAAAEQEDLDYARAALAARKELRAQRDFVAQRRAKVHIFAHRRTIDAALKKADEAVKPVATDKEPSQDAFDAARASLKELKAAAEPARQFAPQDAAFASYLQQVDATLAKHQKTIDDRFVALSADSHRAKVEDARAALSKVMKDLTSASPDAKFTEADKAVSELEKRLEEGKPLEADRKYGAVAEKGRAEVAEAKKKKDLAWSETGLTRLKAEIEPAHKDLKASARLVRGRKPTEDQLAEARTAAIVVRKLLEKFAPEAARSQAFAQYVDEVKATLVEVEAQLLLRALETATRDVKAAQRNVERKSPTTEHFAELNSALLVLEKTLEPANPKDPNTSAQVLESKQVAHDARWMLNKRRLEVDIELQQARVEDAREEAAKVLAKLDEYGFEQLPQVEEAIAAIGKALEAGTELTTKDRTYAAYDREVKRRIDEANRKLAARRLVLTANEAKAQLADGLAGLKAALETAKQPASTDADVDAAAKKLDALVQYIEQHLELEQKAGSYASAAERARAELARQQENLMFAQAARELRKKTGELLASAEAAFREAEASKDLRTQKTQYEKALALFKGCNSEGTALYEANPALLKIVVLVDGAPSSPKAVTTLCTQRAEATVPLLKPLTALIAFDEGPKRAYEKAKALMAKNKKPEALAEFDECTATGLTLQYRNPELRDRSFEVAGGQVTLVELTKQCSAQAKAIRGK